MKTKPSNISSESLVEQFQQGNQNALQMLIKRYHPVFRERVVHYTGARDAADDLVQESWYAIIKKLPDVRLRINFEAWAFTIVRRKCIDWIRVQQRQREREQRVENAPEMPVEENPDDDEDKKALVKSAILQLAPSHRIVLELFYLKNLSLKEISRILEIPAGTVKSRLFKAREYLKNRIK